MDWLAKSGVVGYILAGVSVVTLAVFLERAFILHLERRRLSRGMGMMKDISDAIRENRGASPDRLSELVSLKVRMRSSSFPPGSPLSALCSPFRRCWAFWERFSA